MKIKFEHEKETKNTVRFKAVPEGAAIETIYIQKSALKELDYKGTEPITITISKEE